MPWNSIHIISKGLLEFFAKPSESDPLGEATGSLKTTSFIRNVCLYFLSSGIFLMNNIFLENDAAFQICFL